MPFKNPEARRAAKRRYYEDNREEVNARARRRREDNPKRKRDIDYRYARRRAGLLLSDPVLSLADRAARGRRVKQYKRIHADPVAMKMLDDRVPLRAKLIRLAMHPETPPFEKRRALDKLISQEGN